MAHRSAPAAVGDKRGREGENSTGVVPGEAVNVDKVDNQPKGKKSIPKELLAVTAVERIILSFSRLSEDDKSKFLRNIGATSAADVRKDGAKSTQNLMRQSLSQVAHTPQVKPRAEQGVGGKNSRKKATSAKEPKVRVDFGEQVNHTIARIQSGLLTWEKAREVDNNYAVTKENLKQQKEVLGRLKKVGASTAEADRTGWMLKALADQTAVMEKIHAEALGCGLWPTI